MAMGETHNTLGIGEIYQLMAQIVKKYTVYNRYCSEVYMECLLE